MRDWLAFHREWRRIIAWLDDIDGRHDAAMQKATGTAEDLRDASWEFNSDRQFAQDEFAKLTTKFLVRKARRLLLPVPEFSLDKGPWVESEILPGTYHLNEHGLAELRIAIRREQKERHEVWLLWLAGLTGLVGAISGLVAVIVS